MFRPEQEFTEAPCISDGSSDFGAADRYQQKEQVVSKTSNVEMSPPSTPAPKAIEHAIANLRTEGLASTLIPNHVVKKSYACSDIVFPKPFGIDEAR